MKNLIPIERIESKIYLIRGQKVMLDRDLAELYGIETRGLNKAVTRNLERFPADFMFQLNREECKNLMFQFGTSSLVVGKAGWGGTRKLPRAFTEQGVAMLSSVLRSKRAIRVNIAIMRAFVRLKQALALHKELADKFKELEARVDGHDTAIVQIVEEIRRIIQVEEKPRGKIGFAVGGGEELGN